MHNRSCFWKHFGSECVNESLKLLKCAGKYFYPTFSSFFTNLSEKKSFSVRSEILGLLPNTLTTNYEYYHNNTDNLPLPLQMQLSGKLNRFSRTFIAFSDSASNFEHFQKKITLITPVFLKLYTHIDVFTYMHKRCCFWKPYGSERANKSLKLLKFAENYFYPTFSSFLANLT